MKLGVNPRGQSTRWVWVVMISFTLLFVLSFQHELLWLFGIRQAQTVDPLAAAPQVSEDANAFAILSFNCLWGFGIFPLWMILVAFQALLPIDNIIVRPLQAVIEAYRAAWYLFFYIIRMHGPAIFVRDGKPITTHSDERRTDGPGVIVVDYNSAVVLEERGSPRGITSALKNLVIRFFQLLGVFDASENPRVRGSGIVFTRPRERIKGVVDLRKQFNLQPGVRCYTRDGIELFANVWTITSVGLEAERLEVAFEGSPAPDNLRVVRMHILPNGARRVTSFNDDLDSADRMEIFGLWQRGLLEFIPMDFVEPPPDTFQERVFAAVTSQARSNGDVLPWTALPTRVAAGFYREELSNINYDELYDIRENGDFPLPGFRAKLRNRMRNNGILAFSLIQWYPPGSKSPQPLQQGQVYMHTDLRRSSLRLLENPKVLRSHGIRVLVSGFGDLSPVNEEVYQQRVDAWKAAWEGDIAGQMANSDRAALLAAGRARVEAQQELWLGLSQLFSGNELTEEALAIRVLQALDQAAADPKTRALLPANTLGMLQYINTMLMPGSYLTGMPVGGPPQLTPPPPSGGKS